MAKNEKPLQSEKITINLGFVDLGQIDLLVKEGFYSNRTDLIRTAIRNQLAVHSDVVKATVAQKTLVLGLCAYNKKDFESLKAQGKTLQIQVVGLVTLSDDISADLALEIIDSMIVLGALHAPVHVREALEKAGKLN